MPCWTLEALNAAISAQSSWPRALSLMALGLERRLTLDVVSYTAAITVCPWPLALRLLELLRRGQRPNQMALTAACRACARGRAWPKALEIFKELEATEQQNLLAHCDLVNAHSSSRHLEPRSGAGYPEDSLGRVYACTKGMWLSCCFLRIMI